MDANTECRQETRFEVLPGGLSPRAMTLRQRFDSHVIRGEGESACWAWRGNVRADGVPLFSIAKGGNGGTWAAARVAFSIEYGPLVRFQVIEPRCGNKLCVRPDHFRIVKRTRRAPAHVNKFSDDDRRTAIECALTYGVPQASTALRIKVSTLRRWVREFVRACRNGNGATAPGTTTTTTTTDEAAT